MSPVGTKVFVFVELAMPLKFVHSAQTLPGVGQPVSPGEPWPSNSGQSISVWELLIKIKGLETDPDCSEPAPPGVVEVELARIVAV